MATSIVQLILSSITIYRTRGPQLDRYGYAAFGLSVFPYTFMSFVSLVCIGIVGDYPSLYVMRTPMLEEAEGRGGTRISGEIGTLRKTMDDEKVDDRTGGAGGEGKEFVAVRMWKETGNGENILAVQVDEAKPPTKFKLVDCDKTATHEIGVSHIGHCDASISSYSVWLLVPGLLFSGVLSKLLSELPQIILKRIQRQSAKSKCPRLASLYLHIKELTVVFFIASPILALVLPHLLIVFLTGFKKRESTAVERGFMMSWLVMSQVCGEYSIKIISTHPTFFIAFPQMSRRAVLLLFLVVPVLLASPIGGFVVVAKMLREFGSCSLIL